MLNDWKKLKQSGTHKRNLQRTQLIFLEESRQLVNVMRSSSSVIRQCFADNNSTLLNNYHHQAGLTGNEHQRHLQHQATTSVYL